ncbi:MAG TPA: prepilin-type cleavage/methylation domain-containing protein, partial [Myxococcaceae bacterium]|nr:prepilin-type cleavage/methylation domain-containing protein [Myxococcaceae bacterium]
VPLDMQAPTVDSPAGPPGTHFREQAVLDEPCFHQAAEGGESPVLVKVVRSGFYVASFDDDGDAATPGGTPYLMLHRGVDLNDDGRIDGDDATPIAVGVEQLQVAYILNTVGRAEPLLVGVNDPVPWGESWNLGTPEEERPRLEDPYGSPRRLTRHPANIRQVRLTLVARSTKPDRQRLGDDVLTLDAASTEGPTLPSGAAAWRHLENLGATPAQGFVPRGGGFRRAVLREAIAPKNLLMRSQFTPIHRGGG